MPSLGPVPNYGAPESFGAFASAEVGAELATGGAVLLGIGIAYIGMRMVIEGKNPLKS